MKQQQNKALAEDQKRYFAGLCPPLPVTDLPVMTVAAASDTNYCPHMAALIASVFFHADKGKFTDFIVLDGGLSAEEKEKLTSLEALHPHVRICFIPMAGSFSEVKIRKRFTEVANYRLALPDILLNRERCLYLDADMIVLEDISKVWASDLEGKAIGAVRHWSFYADYLQGSRSLSKYYVKGKRVSYENYIKNVLGVKNPERIIFSSPLLFDLAEMRRLNLLPAMIRDLINYDYLFPDQDVLNKYLADHQVKHLSPRWLVNIPHSNPPEGLPEFMRKEDEEAVKNPAFLHGKLWQGERELLPFSDQYRYFLKKTPFYNKVYQPDGSLRNRPKSGMDLFLLRRESELKKFRCWYRSFSPVELAG